MIHAIALIMMMFIAIFGTLYIFRDDETHKAHK